MSKTIKLFKEIKAELALDDVEEGNLIQICQTIAKRSDLIVQIGQSAPF